jgi:hypothetical protein
VICLGLVLACAPRSGVPLTERDTSATPVGPVVSLERTPCFGSCPSYTVSVSSSGLVAYNGRANVHRVGTDTARIAPQRVEALLLELERAGYFTFADRYALSEPTCRRYITDSPSAISSATFRGRTKRIEHDYGCAGVPGALTVLEQRIDEVLGSGRWTGR